MDSTGRQMIEAAIAGLASCASGRVAVAMSGGVDSSVAAVLLKEARLDVVGVTLKMQDCGEPRESRSCCGIDGAARAAEVAKHLGIAHHVLDVRNEFQSLVLQHSWDEYSSGRTPNPCLLCNERIKFGRMIEWARDLGATRIATGHYVRLGSAPGGAVTLLRGADRTKDQSYFLAGLSREQLTFSVFPLGGLRKNVVRDFARERDLKAASAPESQDACLAGSGQSFAENLRMMFDGQPCAGKVVDASGKAFGNHPGLHNFTIGQRKGLGIPAPSRLWVKEIRRSDCTVVLTGNEDDLMSSGFVATGMSWVGEPPEDLCQCQVQIRYRHGAAPCTVRTRGEKTRVLFRKPVRAVTPGQAAVLYMGETVLGRGWIDDTFRDETTCSSPLPPGSGQE